MKLKRSKHFHAEVSTSSLNDIMFFLLLFFLIISTLSNPNVIKMLLPKSDSVQKVSKQQITLSVTNEKKYFINQREVAFNNIESELRIRTKGLESPTITVRMAPQLNVQDLVDVLQIGNRLDIKMVLATEKKE